MILLFTHSTELHLLFLAVHDFEVCDLYLAELESLAVLPFHLPAVIFGMSDQAPIKFIGCLCEERATFNKTADAFNYKSIR